MTRRSVTRSKTDFRDHLIEAMAPLLLASQYAKQVACEPWEFAVEIEQLVALGLAPNDFRWLVRSGLVTHRREVTLEGENGRHFQAAGDLTYCERSCFVLTDCGIRIAQQFHQAANVSLPVDSKLGIEQVSQNGTVHKQGVSKTSVPIWEAERRELRFDGEVVKHFKWVAVNQQAILNAFEEDGWPPRIDDPLPPNAEQDSKRRLADTIKCLNRKQCYAVVHFRGDGTGEGVIWEIVDLPE
ncbi:hypothetical protein RB4296 [Rhodopirellula baltica SH 1]|uniref:Uncharacterized protein n=2 Tax=Rhodopirellula baltica TaxID=265606 RepID=Q7USU3_RHOBA|nr:hypothetical protein RB4296 [Rhodopirellula baltica SH 1]